MKLKTRVVVLAIALTVSYTVYTLSFHKHIWGKATQKEEVMRAELARPGISKSVHDKQRNASTSWLSETERKKYLQLELERLRVDFRSAASNFKGWPWTIAASWVNARQIYPEQHPELASILFALSSAKIISADVLPKGTQLKMLFVLEGDQKVVFKQKRYDRDYVVSGKPYDGFDRHNGEIASFHLDRIFNFRRSPLTVGRIVNLREEVLPVATDRLKKTFLTENDNLCYYGVCYYCREEEKACADGDIMEGAVTLWLPEEYSSFTKLRHPYQRTYVNGRNAKWEVDESYCENIVKHTAPYDSGPRLLDVADACVFDYLIGNADRHHYEVFKDKGNDVMLLLMDNAKSFGNPHLHEPSILAPLRQCCLLRNSTWVRLQHLNNGVLTQLLESALETDPIAPVLHHLHLKAMEERLPHLLSTIEQCIKMRGRDKVLVNDWKGLKPVT